MIVVWKLPVQGLDRFKSVGLVSEVLTETPQPERASEKVACGVRRNPGIFHAERAETQQQLGAKAGDKAVVDLFACSPQYLKEQVDVLRLVV